MTDTSFTVGAKITWDGTQLVAGANASAAELQKLNAAAAATQKQVGTATAGGASGGASNAAEFQKTIDGMVASLKRLDTATTASTRRLEELSAAGTKTGGGGAGAGTPKAITEQSDALDRLIGRLDPTIKAQQRLAQGQEALGAALKAGKIDAQQYEHSMALLHARLDQAKDKAAANTLTFGNLREGHLSLSSAMRMGATVLGGLIGGLIGGSAASLLAEGATKALAWAWEQATSGSRVYVAELDRLQGALDKNKVAADKLTVSIKLAAEAKAAATRGTADQIKTDIDAQIAALEKQRAAEVILFRAQQSRAKVDPNQAPAVIAIDEQIRVLREKQSTMTEVVQALVYPSDIFDRGGVLRMPFGPRKGESAGPGPNKPTGGGSNPIRDLLKSQAEELAKLQGALDGAVWGAYDELEAKLKAGKASASDAAKAHENFWAIIEAKGTAAIKTYTAETEKQLRILEAEIAGKRELIPLIELEAQLTEQYGRGYVEKHRARIEQMAAERAAVGKMRETWQTTTSFIESSADRVGDAIGQSIIAPLDQSGAAMKNMAKMWESTVMSIIAEANKLLIINPLLNSIFGGNRPTGYGAGGLMERLLGSVGSWFGSSSSSSGWASGSANSLGPATYSHEGGMAGHGRSAMVPMALFADAPRAHAGAMLGPRERPIIAEEGEAIFTPRQMANADALFNVLKNRGTGDGDISIEIYDQRSGGKEGGKSQASAQQSRGAGGQRQIKIFVRDAVREQIANGDYDQAAGQAWGVARRGRGS